MTFNLLVRRRTVLDHEIREPTLLAIALVVAAFVGLLAVCVVAIAGVPLLGYGGYTFIVLFITLGHLVAFRRQPQPVPVASTGRQRWLRRIGFGARLVFITVLTLWLGLLFWAMVCRGGPVPPGKTDPNDIRVVTWNIHCGLDEGLPWKQFDWPRRKHSLRAALEQARPDILCVQEANPEQVAFLEEVLPGHHRLGIGRDGEVGGEHCAIFFDKERFETIGGSTFWLEEPIDQPRAGSALDVKRICTWARLRDRVSGRTLRVYNTHLYLTEAPRWHAAELILAHIQGGDPVDAVLLTADFNASPSAPSRRLFIECGLADSAERAGVPVGRPTFHMGYGIGLSCLDGILVDRHWNVHNHLVLNIKPRNSFPSDHFALLADLAWRD